MIKGPSAHIHETARFGGGMEGGREGGRDSSSALSETE